MTNSLRVWVYAPPLESGAGSVMLSRIPQGKVTHPGANIRVKPLCQLIPQKDLSEGYRADELLSHTLPEFLTHQLMRENKRAVVLKPLNFGEVCCAG